MISEVVMPQMGADMTEGTVLRWLKHEGDPVERGEIIAEIETDKANVEIEAFDGGVFRKTVASEGDTVPVGQVIAVVAALEDDISAYTNGASGSIAKQAEAKAAAPTPPAAATREPQTTPYAERPATPAPPAEVRPPGPTVSQTAPVKAQNGRLRVSPVARRIAEERGIDLRTIHGTGPDGRIIKRDLESAATAPASAPAPAAPPPARPVPAVPSSSTQPTAQAFAAGPIVMSKMRQAIARRMSQSKRDAPHYYLLVDIDMTDAMEFRSDANTALDKDSHISVNDLIVRASALALQRHPTFNVTAEGEQMVVRDRQNICIGIALDEGLIAPAIIDAGAKSLQQIARDAKDLIARAKGGALRPDELTVGTFTISNLGAYGIETLVAIIQPPQTAILGVGVVAQQPAVIEGAVEVRQMMKVALSADHRVTDGAQGAQFLAEIKRLLEHPLLLLL